MHGGYKQMNEGEAFLNKQSSNSDSLYNDEGGASSYGNKNYSEFWLVN